MANLVAITPTYLTGLTAAQLTTLNPTLQPYEIAIESDTLKQKKGDGSTAWTSLGYFAGGQIGASLMTTPVATVTITEWGNGKDVYTVLTLTNFIVGALAGAGAALGMGNIVAAFPAGQQLELAYSFSALVLTAAGTAVATVKTGLGSVIGSGAVSVLSGTGTFQDRLTGQTLATDPAGGAAVSALAGATAGIGTGIAMNGAAAVKNVFLNAAATWNANNTGNLTATGTIIIKWTKMS